MTTLVSARATTRAMSCDATIVVTGPSPELTTRLARLGAQRLHELERCWSRFLPDSELSQLNRAGGAPRRVGTDTIVLVDALVTAWRATGGAFDPTLLGALVGLGYAASRDDADLRTSLAPDIRPVGDVDAILIDLRQGIVRLPVGTALDPGGIGKGLAGDLIGRELVDSGAAGVLVEVGGDVAVTGHAPSADTWRIAIDDPFGDAAPVEVRLTEGGVATSSSRIRTWMAGHRHRHHLIDPATQTSTERDVVACSIIAGTAAGAEAFAKMAFVDGCEASVARYTELGLAARVTTSDGRHHVSAGWEEFAR